MGFTEPDPYTCGRCGELIEEQMLFKTEDDEIVHLDCGPDVLTANYPEDLKRMPTQVCKGLWAAKTVEDHTYILEPDGSIVDKMTEDELNVMLSRLNSKV